MSSSVIGTLWALPGYIGELFTADPVRTPFLSSIGSLTGGGKKTENFEFPTSNDYSLTAAAQTAITEDDTVSAPTNKDYAPTQYKNVCEIHYLGIQATYPALATGGRISGIATTGESLTTDNLMAGKIAQRLQDLARMVEWAMLQGTYQISTDADVANQMRGLIEAASDASNTVAAGSIDLSTALIEELIRTMFANGAMFSDPVLIVNIFQKQKISSLYGYAPTDRTIGGVNIQEVEMDIGRVGVMLNPFQPAATLTLADLAVCSPVFQQVPGKPLGIFYEELSRNSASVQGQLFGQVGLDHGPKFAHGTITGLTTS